MLKEISIRNVALIEELHIELSGGLIVLTGETGAGKSIIIDSLGFVFGERANKDLIRNGESSASVEVLFEIEHDSALEYIRGKGVEVDGDNALLLCRSITADGKGICRINGRTVPLGMLRDVSSVLAEICGQHEHQSLTDPRNHLNFIDRFCESDELTEIKKILEKKCAEHDVINEQILSISGNDSERAAKIEIYNYQINELTSAKLKPGEESELSERKKALNNFEKLFSSVSKALELLSESNGSGLSAADKVARALTHVSQIAALTQGFEHSADKLEEAHSLVKEVTESLLNLCDGLEADPNELDKIEARLDLIYKLKRKYGVTDGDKLTEHLEHIKTMLDSIVNSEEECGKLRLKRDELEAEIENLCGKLSDSRKQVCGELSSSVIKTLAELGMNNAVFTVEFTKKASFTSNGYDRAEFMISANPGEPPKPLTRIASGGEMSRMMLALKNVLISADETETVIFDEIDAGISGRTAQKVAEKLSKLAKGHQILCVSHLPQIAAMADSHRLIEKITSGDRTRTTVKLLGSDESVSELARLTGGAEITEATLAAAKEMKELAAKIK